MSFLRCGSLKSLPRSDLLTKSVEECEIMNKVMHCNEVSDERSVKPASINAKLQNVNEMLSCSTTLVQTVQMALK